MSGWKGRSVVMLPPYFLTDHRLVLFPLSPTPADADAAVTSPLAASTPNLALLVSSNPQDFETLLQQFYNLVASAYNQTPPTTRSGTVQELVQNLPSSSSPSTPPTVANPAYFNTESFSTGLTATLLSTITATTPPQLFLIDGRSFSSWTEAHQEIITPLLADESLSQVPVVWLLEEHQQDEFEISHSATTYASYTEWSLGQRATYQEIMPTSFFYPAHESANLLYSRVKGLLRVSEGRVKRRQTYVEQSQAERQLLLTLSSFENNTQDAIISINPDYRITNWNKGAERIYGWTAREAVGQSIAIIDYDGSLTSFEAGIRAANPSYIPTLSQGNQWSGVAIHKDRIGTKIIIEANVTAVRNPEGELIELIGINRDVTTQRRFQHELQEQKEALAKSNAFLESIIEQSPVGILVYDKDGLCVRLNAACAKIYGFLDSAVLVGNYNVLKDAFSIESGLTQTILPAFKGERIVSIPFQEYDFTAFDPIYGVSQQHSILNAKFFPLLDAKGRTQNVITLVEDITHQRRLETQLAQSQKMEVLGNLAGSIAHDFNNLLGVSTLSLDSLVYTLADKYPELAELDEVAELAEVNRQATALTSQLLLFTRSQQLINVAGDDLCQIKDFLKIISPLLHRAVGSNVNLKVKDETTIKVEAEYSPAPEKEGKNSQTLIPLIKVPITSLSQLVINLAVNAKDALSERAVAAVATGEDNKDWQGEITIHAFSKRFNQLPLPGFQPVPLPTPTNATGANPSSIARYVVIPTDSISPNFRPEKDWYVGISIEDNGTGIAKDQLDHIFLPLYTTKTVGKGTGLGLASCYAIARNNQGWFEVETQLGKGSRFTFYLPVVSSILPQVKEATTNPNPNHHTTTSEHNGTVGNSDGFGGEAVTRTTTTTIPLTFLLRPETQITTQTEDVLATALELSSTPSFANTTSVPTILVAEDDTGLRNNLIT